MSGDELKIEGLFRERSRVNALPIRIGFCGASGTGKTTMARWISETYNIPMNPVGARSVAQEMGFDSPYGVDGARKRGEFQHRLQKAKLAWEAERKAFVTDRTFVDELTYTMLHDYKAVTREYLKNVADGMRNYTHVILFPQSVFQNLDGDHRRVDDKVYHEMFEMIVEAGLRKFPCHRFYDVVGRPDLVSRKEHLGHMIRIFDGVTGP